MDYELYKNLINLLKIFHNKPNQLARFLIESESLTSTFKKKIKDSSKLKELDPTETPLHFLSIEDLKDYYNSLISEQEKKPSKSRDDLHKELLKKIKDAIDIENYEEAARLRDYMIKNNFKKN